MDISLGRFLRSHAVQARKSELLHPSTASTVLLEGNKCPADWLVNESWPVIALLHWMLSLLLLRLQAEMVLQSHASLEYITGS